MITIETIIASVPGLEIVEVTAWVEQRWVQPETAESGEWVFHEVDIARLRFIHEMRRDMGINDEAVPVVLGLLDQIYGLRATLRAMEVRLGEQAGAIDDGQS